MDNFVIFSLDTNTYLKTIKLEGSEGNFNFDGVREAALRFDRQQAEFFAAWLRRMHPNLKIEIIDLAAPEQRLAQVREYVEKLKQEVAESGKFPRHILDSKPAPLSDVVSDLEHLLNG